MPAGKPSRNILIIVLLIIAVTAGAAAAFLLLESPSAEPGTPPGGGGMPVQLTAEERQWIALHPAITICPDPGYPPFEYYDAQGRYRGISADVLQRIAENTGLTITAVRQPDWNACIQMVRKNQTDLLGAVYISDLRRSYLNYTLPYYQPPLVIITRKGADQHLTLDDLAGKTVAVVDNYTSAILVQRQYPEIRTLTVPNVRTGLQMVSYGMADAYFGDLASASWDTDHEGLTNLQIAGDYTPPDPQQFQFSIGVRSNEPELVEILNKGMANISPAERNQIINRWVSISLHPSGIDPRIVMAFLVCIAILLVLAGIFIAWNRALQRAVDEKTRELSQELKERKNDQEALAFARKKLSILNSITIQEIESAVFSLSAYVELDKSADSPEQHQIFVAKQRQILQAIAGSLKFAKDYQALGLSPPRWQKVRQTFLYGISHLDLGRLDRKLDVEESLEIYADPLLENVFLTLAENTALHAATATEIRLFSERSDAGLVLVFEDNGPGIPEERKEAIFNRTSAEKRGMGLFLVREILGNTDITIRETGTFGSGARFEMTIPQEIFRFQESP